MLNLESLFLYMWPLLIHILSYCILYWQRLQKNSTLFHTIHKVQSIKHWFLSHVVVRRTSATRQSSSWRPPTPPWTSPTRPPSRPSTTATTPRRSLRTSWGTTAGRPTAPGCCGIVSDWHELWNENFTDVHRIDNDVERLKNCAVARQLQYKN